MRLGIASCARRACEPTFKLKVHNLLGFHAHSSLHVDETVWCNSSTVNKTSHELQQRNGRLKVYCPCGDQLNVRLALAGQAEYKVQDGNNNNEVEIEPQGNIFPPTTHE